MMYIVYFPVGFLHHIVFAAEGFPSTKGLLARVGWSGRPTNC
jgi:hypothetical protein